MLENALFLALVTERLTAAIVAPIKQKFQTIDFWWLVYLSWLIGGALVFLAGINLFPDMFSNELVGRVLSSVVAGGGANLLHDLFDRK